MSGIPSVTIVAVGDVSLGDHPMRVGCGIGSRLRVEGQQRRTYPFEHVAPLFADADVVFGNLETALGEAGLRPGELRSIEMRGPADGAARLRLAGFDVLNIANNHILQHDVTAFESTVSALGAQRIAVVGIAQSPSPGTVPVVLERGGLRVAFLGYAFEPDKYFSGSPLYAFGPACDIPAEVRRAREQADAVVCSFHWGEEFIRYPNEGMRALARQSIDAGAHLVLGHHPHVFHGVESYKGGLIAYSLGNFAFDMPWDPALRQGLVLRVELTAQGVATFAPVFVEADRDYQPVPVDANRSAAIQAEFDSLSAGLANPPSDDQYHREYAALVAKNRSQSYAYLLRHGFDYPPAILASILARPILSRLRG